MSDRVVSVYAQNDAGAIQKVSTWYQLVQPHEVTDGIELLSEVGGETAPEGYVWVAVSWSLLMPGFKVKKGVTEADYLALVVAGKASRGELPLDDAVEVAS